MDKNKLAPFSMAHGVESHCLHILQNTCITHSTEKHHTNYHLAYGMMPKSQLPMTPAIQAHVRHGPVGEQPVHRQLHRLLDSVPANASQQIHLHMYIKHTTTPCNYY